ncbi:MAG TPA: CHASE3 domain-containing protein, partial [Terriglobales bacterium]|nr:CHASE3 domain-containing protein [Terriglobales bacterium]
MDRARFQKILRRVVALPLVLATILALALLFGIQSLVSRERWVEHTDQALQVAQTLYRADVDQETGLRAYLLTKDEAFLRPYLDGRDRLRKMRARLQQLIADDPGQQARNDQVLRAYENWSLFAEEAIARARDGEDVSDVKLQLRGKELMDEVRRTRADFIAHEEQLRDERLARSRRTLKVVDVSVIGICVLIGGLFGLLGRKQLLTLSQAFSTALNTAEAKALEAREQKEWLRTTLQSIGDAVIATDTAGTVTFMNAVAEKLTGWQCEEASGKPLPEIFHIVNEQTREAVENPVEKVRRLARVVGLANHTLLISRSGKEFAIDDSGAPILDSSGALTGIVLVFRDVTQQRSLEAALQSNERLAVAGRLSASIAHEIHNPLDTVGNLLFLIGEKTADQPEIQKLVGTAQREVLHVAQISRNMLGLHREAQTPLPVKLNELLDGVVALIEATVAKGKREFRVEHGFQGEIETFPAELRQVFTNVLKNAVEATADGGTIRIFSVAAEEAGRQGVLVQIS